MTDPVNAALLGQDPSLSEEAAGGLSMSAATGWPCFDSVPPVLSPAQPQLQVTTTFAAGHPCSFWAAS